MKEEAEKRELEMKKRDHENNNGEDEKTPKCFIPPESKFRVVWVSTACIVVVSSIVVEGYSVEKWEFVSNY